MNNLNDFSLESNSSSNNEDDSSVVPKLGIDLKEETTQSNHFSKFKKSTKRNKIILTTVAFFALSLVGVVAATFLASQSQDNRQQAFEGIDPYLTPTSTPTLTLTPTISPTLTLTLTPTPVITNRPTTETSCSEAGFWLGGVCYLNGEILPGGTHIVIPAGKAYSYNSLMTIEKARELGLLDPVEEEDSEVVVEGGEDGGSGTEENSSDYLITDVSLSNALEACKDPFTFEKGRCVPNQKSAVWNSEWINGSGCGAMQALYYAYEKDPNIDPDAFLNKYYPEYLSGEKEGYTHDATNVEVLNDLGYDVEPFPKSLVYSSEKEIENGNTFFVKGVFSNGVNHYFSIDNVYTNEQGRTVFETVDSYFDVDKCVSTGDTSVECFNSSNQLVTTLDLSDQETSVYLVVDGEDENTSKGVL